jgi:DNA polymerase-3 subunit gamma/tau
VKEQEDLAWAPQPFAVLEMALVRLATLPAGDEVAALLSRLEALEARLRGAGPAGSPPSASGRAPERPRAGGGGGRPQPASEDAAPIAGAETEALPPAVVFDRLRAFAGKQDPGLFAALSGGRLVRLEASRLCLGVPAGFAARRLEQKREPLERCCESFFGRRVAIELEILPEAPAEGAARGSDAEALRRLRQQALSHPAVNAALELLEAEIVDIQPLGAGR